MDLSFICHVTSNFIFIFWFFLFILLQKHHINYMHCNIMKSFFSLMLLVMISELSFELLSLLVNGWALYISLSDSMYNYNVMEFGVRKELWKETLSWRPCNKLPLRLNLVPIMHIYLISILFFRQRDTQFVRGCEVLP